MRDLILKIIITIILLRASNTKGTDYSEALDKAREAAMIQSGLQSKINDTRKWAEKEAYLVARKIGIEKEVGVCVYLFVVYRNRSIDLGVGNQKRLRLYQNKAEFEIKF
jgi:hypothetical protein